jgi:endonuclease/exonuclease/phosphatase family metal-dependent hydrolase
MLGGNKIIPGDLITYDFRINLNENINEYNNEEVPKLKVLQWNIERGYKLDDILIKLKSHNADIICLQELDISCERSNERNCVLEIAKYLNMKISFVVEFEELRSKFRTKLLQGGGFHGNAILSKYDFNPYVSNFFHIFIF